MEALYHFLWQRKMIGSRLSAVGGKKVRVLSPGLHNADSGPDFSHARLEVGDTQWVGNVEIHVKASDWFRHGHDKDTAYDSVILHVVAVNDTKVYRSDGSEIMQTIVTLPQDFYTLYAHLVENMDASRCLHMLPSLPPLTITDWIESLGMERLQFKATRIKDIYRSLGNDWEQTLFIALSRAMGFGLNAVPFELLAKSLPLNYVFRHADNPIQIESLLFGQAGMLDPSVFAQDDYYQLLCREYLFLARKYNLKPLRRDLWKYARTRPQNFPHRRIAVLASFLTTDFRLRDALMTAMGDYDILYGIFSRRASRYWENHASFGVTTDHRQSASLTRKSIESLIINVVAPFYLAYGSITGNCDLGEKSIDLLTSLAPEINSKVSPWQGGGIKARNAFESQALIHLRREYCEANRCLQCRFGCRLLSGRISG